MIEEEFDFEDEQENNEQGDVIVELPPTRVIRAPMGPKEPKVEAKAESATAEALTKEQCCTYAEAAQKLKGGMPALFVGLREGKIRRAMFDGVWHAAKADLP